MFTNIVITVSYFVIIASFCQARNCTENEGFYECKNGKCIPDSWVCDGARDCPDGDDEIHVKCGSVEKICKGLHFECVDPHSGQIKCARPEWRCDGFVDCAEGIDEENCAQPQPYLLPLFGQPTPKNSGHLITAPESTIPTVDEIPQNDTKCDASTFDCGDGVCIDRDKLCDDKNDCPDGSDEAEKRCSVPPVFPLIQPSVSTLSTTPITTLPKTSTTIKLFTMPQTTHSTFITKLLPISSTFQQTHNLVNTDYPVTVNPFSRSKKSPDENKNVIAATRFPHPNTKTNSFPLLNIQQQPAIINSNSPTSVASQNSVGYGNPIVPVRNFQVLFPLHVEMTNLITRQPSSVSSEQNTNI